MRLTRCEHRPEPSQLPGKGLWVHHISFRGSPPRGAIEGRAWQHRALPTSSLFYPPRSHLLLPLSRARAPRSMAAPSTLVPGDPALCTSHAPAPKAMLPPPSPPPHHEMLPRWLPAASRPRSRAVAVSHGWRHTAWSAIGDDRDTELECLKQGGGINKKKNKSPLLVTGGAAPGLCNRIKRGAKAGPRRKVSYGKMYSAEGLERLPLPGRAQQPSAGL